MTRVEDMAGRSRHRARVQKGEIERNAYRIALETDAGSGWWGRQRFKLDEEGAYEPLRVDPAIEARGGGWRSCGGRDQAGGRPGAGPPPQGASGAGQRALPDEGGVALPRDGRGRL